MFPRPAHPEDSLRPAVALRAIPSAHRAPTPLRHRTVNCASTVNLSSGWRCLLLLTPASPRLSNPCVRVTRSMVTFPESRPASGVPVSLNEPPTSQTHSLRDTGMRTRSVRTLSRSATDFPRSSRFRKRCSVASSGFRAHIFPGTGASHRKPCRP